MNHVQDQGRACYKRGEYDKAIGYFDRAIGHNPSVQLFDHRAACYEKLGQLQKALKDAKATIHHQREDPTGYLRAGKVLVKMDKPSVALEIYSHGLRCVKHVGKGYELLKKVHKEVLDQVSPPKSVDPMTVLPRELAIQILEYLTFRQRMNACLVSPQWKRFIQTCPDLWRCLDLSQSRKFVRNSFVSRAINVARTKLTSAVLGRFTDLDKALPAISRHCRLEDLTLNDMNQLQLKTIHALLRGERHLKRLCLTSKFNVSHTSMSALFDAGLGDRVEWLSCKFTSMPMANPFVRSFPNLHTLELTAQPDNGLEDVIPGIEKNIPLLRSLTLRLDDLSISLSRQPLDLGGCSHLQYLDLKLPIASASELTLPPSLVVLKLHTVLAPPMSNFWFEHGNAGLEATTFFLPELEELHVEVPRMFVQHALHVVNDRHPESTDSVQAPPSKLHTLAIRGAVLNDNRVDELLKHPRLSELEHLYLPRFVSCSDDDAIRIVDYAPNLRSLDLSETNITGIAVKRALRLKHLRELIVNNCPNIYPDAIELARSHGVKVQHRMSDGANGGRKVRQ